VLALVALLAGAGCSIVGTTTVGGSSGSCENMSSGACSEQLEAVGGRHPGAVSVDLVCRIDRCTRARGAGTAVITFGDGRRVNDTWSYVGDPRPMPVPTCAGIGQALCLQQAQEAFEDVAPSKAVVGIDIRCDVARCDERSGSATRIIRFADGTSEPGRASWEGG